MVQILPARRTFGAEFGKAFGGGIGESIEESLNLARENKALAEKGINLKGIRDPATRAQIIAQELQYGKKSRQAEATRGFDLAKGEAPQAPSYEKKELPSFGQKGEAQERRKGVIEKSRESEGKGSMPQPETTGQKVPLMTPQEIQQRGAQYAQYSSQNGFPMSNEEGQQYMLAQNEIAAQHNQKVDVDQQKRIAAQEKYGAEGELALRNVMPEATDEQAAIFRKKGELSAESGESEADIKRKLAIDARNLKNTIANVERTIEPNRLFTNIKKSLLGTGREFEKEKTGLRIKLKPLLDEGLYDSARNILSKKGYHPEERESILSDLSEGAQKTVAQFPKIELPGKINASDWFNLPSAKTQKPVYSEQQQQSINDAVSQVFKNDPSANLILLRKAFEGKNVDWESFKDALDKGILEGTIKLNDDQFNQLDKLDEPPLNKLDNLLYKGGLIGR